ncbi:MAG TPA: class I SAM-dependent methyltransferase [Pseudonocardia sp.]|jgi:ubiquinone/menaquinone biosynthesis C-methylase UbiE|nr:class I SAM-dependent methyltransferase [Pseudonocardia sp.]
MTVIDEVADRDLKARHRRLWASGDYPSIAAGLIPTLGARLVTACGVRAGQRVLDVGAGTGNAAVPAAATGADVVAADLTPELFDAGRAAAAEAGVDVDWVEADAERLPFADGEFDVVLSCVGVMFAPHHQRAADEMLRVCRPGGTIGNIAWTPEGFVGQLFRTMKPYAPSPPPGASPPPLWGSEEHVRSLFGDRVTDLAVRREHADFDVSPDPETFLEYWKQRYGPTIAVYAANAADPERVAALDRDFLQLLIATNCGAAGGPARWESEYLLFTARKDQDQ